VFDEETPASLVAAFDRAHALYRSPRHWMALQQSGMHQDWSWKRSATLYVELYEKAISKAVSRVGDHA
jgi:starch synthase